MGDDSLSTILAHAIIQKNWDGVQVVYDRLLVIENALKGEIAGVAVAPKAGKKTKKKKKRATKKKTATTGKDWPKGLSPALVKSKMKEKGHSKKELANQVRVSLGAANGWLGKKKRIPNVNSWQQLYDYCDVEMPEAVKTEFDKKSADKKARKKKAKKAKVAKKKSSGKAEDNQAAASEDE